MILGDLGADVVKVERPDSGDDSRQWGPPFAGDSGESCYFLSVNRNKRSVCVDLKTAQGREIVAELAADSDILVENHLPGRLDRLGLGYDELSAKNKGLIYCSITGFGQTGPYASRPGYDIIAASLGGLMHITGPKGGDPVKTGVALTDLTTGLYAHGAIMAALLQRQRNGGVGQHIDVDLLSSQVSCLANLGANYLMEGREASRWGTAHESIVPYQSFATADGYLTLGGANDRQFGEMCQRIGRPDLAQDPHLQSNAQRVQHRHRLIAEMSRTLLSKTTDEWLRALDGAGFPYAPINPLRRVFEDPQVLHHGLVDTVSHPTAGPLAMVGPAVRFSGSDNRIRLPPPGAHYSQG